MAQFDCPAPIPRAGRPWAVTTAVVLNDREALPTPDSRTSFGRQSSAVVGVTFVNFRSFRRVPVASAILSGRSQVQAGNRREPGLINANDLASVIIARRGAWIDAMSLQKLLYYVQAWHLAIADEPAFSEKVKAWKDGPVVPQVWHERRDGRTRSAAVQDLQNITLDPLTSDIVELVLATYGSMSAQELSALTHTESPWMDAREGVPPESESRQEIEREAMASFYRRERRLGGRTAADLAIGGIHLAAHIPDDEPLDIDSLLSSLADDDEESDVDPWGGANLLTAKFAS